MKPICGFGEPGLLEAKLSLAAAAAAAAAAAEFTEQLFEGSTQFSILSFTDFNAKPNVCVKHFN